MNDSGFEVLNGQLCIAEVAGMIQEHRAAEYQAFVDKFKEAKLTPEYVEDASCPIIKECPVSLICKVTDIIPLGSHDMFIADIASVYVNEEMMEEGKLCINRAHLAAYAHGEYYTLGKRIGKFGFSVKKKTPPKKTNKK